MLSGSGSVAEGDDLSTNRQGGSCKRTHVPYRHAISHTAIINHMLRPTHPVHTALVVQHAAWWRIAGQLMAARLHTTVIAGDVNSNTACELPSLCAVTAGGVVNGAHTTASNGRCLVA